MKEQVKVCRKCGESKAINEFPFKKEKRQARCRKCLLEDQRKYRRTYRGQTKGSRIRKSASDFHLDHFIPLACGWGSDSFLNVAYIPQTWNTSKNAQHPFEWADRYFALPDAFGTRAQFDAVAKEIANRNEITVEYLREVCDWAFANARTVEEADMDAELFGRVDAIGAYRAVQKTKHEMAALLAAETTEDTEWIMNLLQIA